MRTYMIGYDLRKPEKDYPALYEAIKNVADGWWHRLDSTWLINSNLNAAQIRDRINPHIDASDRLLVICVGGEWATANMPDDANAWLKNSLRPVRA